MPEKEKPKVVLVKQWITTTDPHINLGLRDDGSVIWASGMPPEEMKKRKIKHLDIKMPLAETMRP